MCLAIPGKITSILREEEFNREGVVSFSGVEKRVNLSYVPEANPGDFVLVHVGFAISRINEDAARRTFELLEELKTEEISEGAR